MMTSNIVQFLKDTDAKIKAEVKKQDLDAKKILTDAYSLITNNSPVDTGQFVANNIITINKSTSVTIDNPTSKSEAVLEANSLIRGLNTKKDFTFIIQNNLPYADKLEAGHSSQAEAGVYGVAEEIIRDDIKRSKR